MESKGRVQELCEKVQVAILGSLFLTVLMVSVDVKQQLKQKAIWLADLSWRVNVKSLTECFWLLGVNVKSRTERFWLLGVNVKSLTECFWLLGVNVKSLTECFWLLGVKVTCRAFLVAWGKRQSLTECFWLLGVNISHLQRVFGCLG